MANGHNPNLILIDGNPTNMRPNDPEVSAILTGYEGILTREQLLLVPTPPATNTHKPIPHYDVIQALVETLGFRKIAPVKEEYAVSKDGMRLFGTMELEQQFHGCRFALGIRNSHDKSFPLGITVGYKVFVCENLGFWGDYTILKKHTKNFNLKEALSIGVDNMQRNYSPMVESVSRWKDTQLSDVDARLNIYEAFIEGGTDLPKRLMPTVHEHYFNPKHEDFSGRNLWSLNNAYTSAINDYDPIARNRAAADIGRYFQQKRL